MMKPDRERLELLRRRQELYADIADNELMLAVDGGARTNRNALINDIRIARERVIEINRRLLEIDGDSAGG